MSAASHKRAYRIVDDPVDADATAFSMIDTPPLRAVLSEEGQCYIRCACGRRFRWDDPRLQRVLDGSGEVAFEGCNDCLCARVLRTSGRAELQARYDRLVVLVQEVLTPRAWDDGPGLLARLRAEVATASPGGHHVH